MQRERRQRRHMMVAVINLIVAQAISTRLPQARRAVIVV